MGSAAFERFRYSFFEDPYSARDGLDTPALAELTGDERTRAEAMLLDFLPDTRAVIGLGELGSKRAEKPLHELFDIACADSGSRKLVYLAKALWQIRPDSRWLEAMIGELANGEDGFLRLDAALALQEFRTPLAVDALVVALDDPEPLVRHHAGSGLLALHGLPHSTQDPQHMVYRVMSEDADRRESGKKELLHTIAGRTIVAPQSLKTS